MLQINLSKREGTNIFPQGIIESLIHSLSRAEHNMGVGYESLNNIDIAQYYHEQSVVHAKEMKKGQATIKWILQVLNNLGDMYHSMGKLTETKAARKEAYMLASEIYNPELPLVLQAGSKLIQFLAINGDYYDADRFARVCYDGHTRAPQDPDSFEAAVAAGDLAAASCNMIEANGP
jgi:hypothetical protein